MANVSVIYYSATGTNAAMAKATAEGASAVGAQTRVRIVAETVPAEVIAQTRNGRHLSRLIKLNPVHRSMISSGRTRWSLALRPGLATWQHNLRRS